MKPKAATAQTRQKKQDVEEDDGDIELGGMDDDDEGVEPEEVFIRKDKNRQDEPGRVKTTSTSTMTERQAREEELRRMMEGESEGEEQGEKEEDEEMVDAEEPPAEQPVPRDPSPSPPPAPQKGKRLVTRKRTVKDAEGFLVTTEEKVWESVDEGEGEKQERPKQKKRTQSEGQSQDEKKSAGKKEKKQGSIMSFFAKRS
ncbi:hypothetical protein KEM55_001405 [Ascosphaera atra]|nr:hypothetical protein KEM55_001405 [Ascosphaera atra]